jgi:hypothetical protein
MTDGIRFALVIFRRSIGPTLTVDVPLAWSSSAARRVGGRYGWCTQHGIMVTI